VEGGKGLIDPCPLWDDDGKAYLVHAFAGSRAGIKSILVIKQLNAEGTRTLDEGVLVYDGHLEDPTIEGPKIYKRKSWYYLFAPAGGVSTGWQTVLRSKNIYGPYERKIVMHQGNTLVNGPHQGAWVSTESGEDWFLHFQDKEAYGRVVHLQPMTWKDGWPVIGTDPDGDGTGEPMARFKKPATGKAYPLATPAESDEFNGRVPGLQWQWMANPQHAWSFLLDSALRLYAVQKADSARNLWALPNVLSQKFPAERFSFTMKFSVSFNGKIRETAGLAIMGTDYGALSVTKDGDGLRILYILCLDADKGTIEKHNVVATVQDTVLYFRVQVEKGALCRFSYSLNGFDFTPAGEGFTAKPGRWTGARVGMFCMREDRTNDAGWMQVDWVRVEKLP
jgi:beta-xylosidase